MEKRKYPFSAAAWSSLKCRSLTAETTRRKRERRSQLVVVWNCIVVVVKTFVWKRVFFKVNYE